MERDPVAIVEEYVENVEPEIRKNAVTALAALGETRSFDHIIKLAIEDPDEEVQNHALVELAEVKEEESRERLKTELERRIKDPDQGKESYKLAARLNPWGFPTEKLKTPLKGRIWYALSLWGFRGTNKDKWLSLKTSGQGFVWGLLGALLIFLWLISAGFSFDNSADWAPGLFWGILIAPIFTVLIVQRVVPLGYRVDRSFGFISTTFSFLFGAALCTLIAFIIVAINKLDSASNDTNMWWITLEFLFYLVIALVSIRMGTIMGYHLTGREKIDYYAQVLIGGLLGIIVLTVLMIAKGQSMGWDNSDNQAGTLWILALPSVFGIAAGFSRIDKEVRGKKVSVWGNAGRIVSGTLFLLLIVYVGRVTSQVRQNLGVGDLFGNTQNLGMVAGDTLTVDAVDDEVPHGIRFSVEDTLKLYAAILDDGGVYIPGRNFRLVVETIPSKPMDNIAPADAPAELDVQLEPGEYRLRVERSRLYNSVDPNEILATIDNAGAKSSSADTAAADPSVRAVLFFAIAAPEHDSLAESNSEINSLAELKNEKLEEVAPDLLEEKRITTSTLSVLPDSTFAKFMADMLERNNVSVSELANSVDQVRISLIGSMLAQRGRYDLLNMITELEGYWYSFPGVRDLFDYCRYGVLHAMDTHPDIVMSMCDQAVEEADYSLPLGDAAYVRSARGIARALTGDNPGAIRDFEYFVAYASEDFENYALRQTWVNSLERGENPFSTEVLRIVVEESVPFTAR